MTLQMLRKGAIAIPEPVKPKRAPAKRVAKAEATRPSVSLALIRSSQAGHLLLAREDFSG